jgi:hypothetical protein
MGNFWRRDPAGNLVINPDAHLTPQDLAELQEAIDKAYAAKYEVKGPGPEGAPELEPRGSEPGPVDEGPSKFSQELPPGEEPAPAPAKKPPKPKELTAEKGRLNPKGAREFLERAKVVETVKNSVSSANETVIVTLEKDGVTAKGIFKPASGEEAGLRENVEAGTYYQREIAASQLNNTLGLDFVPETVQRTIDGEVGSLQLFVEGASRPVYGDTLQRAAYEKFKVFDYVIGNSDRHIGNVLIRGKANLLDETKNGLPILIDHGLSFPEGGNTFWRFPDKLNSSTKFLPDTLEFIQSLDMEEIAKVCVDNGLSKEATKNVLLRIEVIQKNPKFLEDLKQWPDVDPQVVARDAETRANPDSKIRKILKRLYPDD